MNRIVLIGNGFDLAHELKTSYKDFIGWYWEQKSKEIVGKANTSLIDPLCTIMDNLSSEERSFFQPIVCDPVFRKSHGIELYEYFRRANRFTINISDFFEKIQKSINTKGWVDIENEYYSCLLRRVNAFDSYTSADVKSLNRQLDYLCCRLVEYLSVVVGENIVSIESIKDKMFRPIMKKEIAVANVRYSRNGLLEENPPSNILLLNFNYTKTPELYMSGKKWCL